MHGSINTPVVGKQKVPCGPISYPNRAAGWRQVKRWRPRLSQAYEHTFVPKLGERGIGARGGARVRAFVCVALAAVYTLTSLLRSVSWSRLFLKP